MARGRLYGDPSRVGARAAEAELEKARARLEEAFETAVRLLRDKAEKLRAAAVDEAREAFSQALERVRSEEARMELELRTRVAAEKNKYLDMVMEEVRRLVKEEKAGAEWYESYMRGVFERIAADSREHGRLVVRVAREDLDLARRLAGSVGGDVVVSDEPVDILGGAIASTEDGSVTLDYSLDLALREAEPRLRSVASKILFS